MLESCLLDELQSSSNKKYSAPISVAIHVAAVAALLLLGRFATPSPAMVTKPNTLFMPDLTDYLKQIAPPSRSSGGSGGDHSLTLPMAGHPPKIMAEPLAPPQQVIRAVDAKLLVDPALPGPPDVVLPKSNLPLIGYPTATGTTPSNGRGDSGIGDRGKGGVGTGDKGIYGPGVEPGFAYHPGRDGVSNPKLISSVDPEFSDAARQAKHQGTVLVNITVDANGNVRDARIAEPLGLGLDERALAAVRQWKFKPGMKDGKAVPVFAQVAVTFRLL